MWLVLVEQDKFAEMIIEVKKTREEALTYARETFFDAGATDEDVLEADDVLLVDLGELG